MAGAQRLGPARTEARYGLSTHQGSRALTSTGNQAVEGELYVVPSDILGQVDEWERGHFLRKEVSLEDGRTAEAYFLRESRTKEFILGSTSMLEMLEQEGFVPMPNVPGHRHIRFRTGVKDWFDGQDHIDVGPTASIEAVPNTQAEEQEPGGQWHFSLRLNRAGLIFWNPEQHTVGSSEVRYAQRTTADPEQARRWIHATKDYAAQSERVRNLYNWTEGLLRALGE